MVRLYIGAKWEDACREVLLPWLSKPFQWDDPRPNLILAPHVALLNGIKARALSENIPSLGVHFWMPSIARSHLIQSYLSDQQVMDRATLNFLFSSVCKGDDAISQSVRTDPAKLAQAWQLSLQSGRAWEDGRSFSWVKEMERRTEAAGYILSAEADQICQKSVQSKKIFKRTLIWGFDAQHWQERQLMRAIVQASEEVEIVFFSPRIAAEFEDMLWISSWEEERGAALVLGSESTESSPLQETIDLWERQESPSTSNLSIVPPRFLSASSVSHEADVAVALVAEKIIQGGLGRVGLIVPSQHILGREIAARFARAGISFYDGIGKTLFEAADEKFWRGWLQWQRWGSLLDLTHWLVSLATREGIGKVEDCLQMVLAQTLSEDELFFREKLSQLSSEAAQWIREKIKDVSVLPQSASVEEYLKATAEQMRILGWEERAAFVESFLPRYVGVAEVICERAHFIQWLGAVAESRVRQRGRHGDHPFSRIWLLTYEQAEFLPWDFLVLTGMSQEVWPLPPVINPWLNDEAMERWNREIMRVSTRDGQSQIVPQEYSAMVTSSAQNKVARRQIANLLSEVTDGAILTYHRKNAEGRELAPSEEWSSLRKIFNQNSEIAEELVKAFPTEQCEVSLDNLKQVFQRRFDAIVPYGIYDFGAGSSIGEGPSFACKEFSNTLKKPTESWFKLFLEIEKKLRINPLNAWRMTQGIWVHQALKRAFNPSNQRDWGRIPSSEDREKYLLDEFGRIEISLGKFLSDFSLLQSGLSEARWLALSILSAMKEELTDYSYALTEWKIPDSSHFPQNNPPLLKLSGRVDLILSYETPSAESVLPAKVWIVDFKTSKAKDLKSITENKAIKGQGLQVLLYGYLAGFLGAKEVRMSYVLPPGEVGTVNEDILQNADFWQALAMIQQRGVLGSKGETMDEFGAKSDVPLAVLLPEQDILKQKWNLTYPPILHC